MSLSILFDKQTRHADGQLDGAPGRLRPYCGKRNRTPSSESVSCDVSLSFPSFPVGQRHCTTATRPASRRERYRSARVLAVHRR